MRGRCNKFEQANVVAGFDSQDNAEEAVLALRCMGLDDTQIGYFYPIGNGQLADLLVHYHRFAGAVIGSILGVALGAGIGYLFATWNDLPGQSPDLLGLMATCAACGALFLGTAGGMTGLWTVSPGPVASSPTDTPPPFILAIDAGGAVEQVRRMIRDRGGFELPAHRGVIHGTNEMTPAVQPV
ncbi:MAG: hypothetical protein K8U57_04585 [Planctomycetes bacterium]|nr:hypothetical protein [Planctomycetota bacterium]